MPDDIQSLNTQESINHSSIDVQPLNNDTSSIDITTNKDIPSDSSSKVGNNPKATDNTPFGSTISQIVGVLSPSHATTSPTKTTVVVDAAKNADIVSGSTDAVMHNDNSSSTSNSNSTPKSNSIPASNSNVDPIHLAPPITSIQSHPGVKFVQSDELEASFTGISNKNTDPISMVLPDPSSNQNDEKLSSQQPSIIGGIGVALGMLNATNEKNDTELESSSSNNNNNNKNSIVKSSPLLSSTPPTVSKSLIKSYPFLILVLKILNILTWNDNSNHLPVLLVLITIFAILYYEPLIIYLGHLLPVLAIWLYSESKNYVKKYQSEHSTLDDIIQTMTLISNRSEILISPIVELGLTAGDLKRLLFTTVFLSPVYVVISFFFLPPNKMILSLLVLVLTYHSKWSKITRTLLWKSRSFRLLCFYLTGLDFENSGLSKASSLFNLNKRLSKRFGKNNANLGSSDNNSNSKSSSVRFTYVIYENQRRWLGVGWTPNLLSYERTPWTDDFLNESEPIDSFELPQLPLSIDLQDNDSNDLNINSGSIDNDGEILNTKGMVWRWIDKTWRLDLTNDGSIQLSSTKPRTTANPRPDDGWIYYDNTWKNPTTEDGFSKYTRRRRWIRTAELVYITKDGKDIPVKNNNNSNINNNKNVKILENSTPSSISDNDKGVKFENLDSSAAYSSSNDLPTSGQFSERRESKGGLKRSDSGEIKKRKSLRFEEPSTGE